MCAWIEGSIERNSRYVLVTQVVVLFEWKIANGALRIEPDREFQHGLSWSELPLWTFSLSVHEARLQPTQSRTLAQDGFSAMKFPSKSVKKSMGRRHFLQAMRKRFYRTSVVESNSKSDASGSAISFAADDPNPLRAIVSHGNELSATRVSTDVLRRDASMVAFGVPSRFPLHLGRFNPQLNCYVHYHEEV